MAFQTINTSDKELQKIQDNIQTALPSDSSKLVITVDSAGNTVISRSKIPFLFSGGSLVKLALKSGQDNLVPHGLNRTPQMWLICGIDAQAILWSPASSQLTDSSGIAQSANGSYINIKTSASCNAVIWVN